MVSFKAMFSVLFSASYTPLLLALSFQTHLQIITFMQMTLNSTCHSLQLVFLTTSVFLNQLFQTFPTECLQIFSHSILPKLSFSSLDFLSNSLSSTLLLFIFQTMFTSIMLLFLCSKIFYIVFNVLMFIIQLLAVKANKQCWNFTITCWFCS